MFSAQIRSEKVWLATEPSSGLCSGPFPSPVSGDAVLTPPAWLSWPHSPFKIAYYSCAFVCSYEFRGMLAFSEQFSRNCDSLEKDAPLYWCPTVLTPPPSVHVPLPPPNPHDDSPLLPSSSLGPFMSTMQLSAARSLAASSGLGPTPDSLRGGESPCTWASAFSWQIQVFFWETHYGRRKTILKFMKKYPYVLFIFLNWRFIIKTF